MIWEVYTDASQHNLPARRLEIQSILIEMKANTANHAQFALWWDQSIKEPQPAWLTSVRLEEGVLMRTEAEQIVLDFFAIFHRNLSLGDATEQFLQEHQTLLFSQEAEDFLRQLIVYTHQQDDQELANSLEIHLDLIRDSKKYGITGTFARFNKTRQAVLDFCKARTLAEGEQFLQEHQALLFSQEAEDFLHKCMNEQKQLGRYELVVSLEDHLGLLQACKERGIATIFEQMRAGQ